MIYMDALQRVTYSDSSVNRLQTFGHSLDLATIIHALSTPSKWLDRQDIENEGYFDRG